MKLHILSRKTHYWVAIGVSLPVVTIIGTGILLQVKKEVAWVQPVEHKGTGKEPKISFEKILEVCQGVPEAEVKTWKDIDRVDVRPSKGMIKVTAKNSWEIQIDAADGRVLQTAYRRSDTIEAIHDGSWFHPIAKHYLFLPAGVALLLLWMTGMYLFWLPIYVKWRRRRTEARKQALSTQPQGG